MTENIPIVDKSDTVISYKKRNEINAATDIIRSASVWVTNSKGELLIAQRTLDKNTDAGKWAEAVGGTVGDDDSYEVTAYREAEEELGIKNVVLSEGPKQLVANASISYFVQWYYLVLDWPTEDFTLQKSEVEQIKWWNLKYLEQDIKTNPHKYIDELPAMIRLLYP